MREPIIKILEDLTEVIRLQAEIVNDALMLLLQHVSPEDEALKEILEEVKFVKELNQGIEADPLEDEGLPFNVPEREGK